MIKIGGKLKNSNFAKKFLYIIVWRETHNFLEKSNFFKEFLRKIFSRNFYVGEYLSNGIWWDFRVALFYAMNNAQIKPNHLRLIVVGLNSQWLVTLATRSPSAYYIAKLHRLNYYGRYYTSQLQGLLLMAHGKRPETNKSITMYYHSTHLHEKWPFYNYFFPKNTQ